MARYIEMEMLTATGDLWRKFNRGIDRNKSFDEWNSLCASLKLIEVLDELSEQEVFVVIHTHFFLLRRLSRHQEILDFFQSNSRIIESKLVNPALILWYLSMVTLTRYDLKKDLSIVESMNRVSKLLKSVDIVLVYPDWFTETQHNEVMLALSLCFSISRKESLYDDADAFLKAQYALTNGKFYEQIDYLILKFLHLEFLMIQNRLVDAFRLLLDTVDLCGPATILPSKLGGTALRALDNHLKLLDQDQPITNEQFDIWYFASRLRSPSTSEISDVTDCQWSIKDMRIQITNAIRSPRPSDN